MGSRRVSSGEQGLRQRLSLIMCLTGAALCASPAAAQPANGGLAPGIAPYVPPTGRQGPAATPPAVQANRPSSPVPTAAPQVMAAPAASPAATEAANEAYVLGPGDKLRIIVFGETDLSGEFTVADNGEISFPLIGQVAAGSKTVGQVRTEIQNALKQGYLKDPRVSAEVLTFRPFYILGEVAKPGEYQYSSGISVINAVATAGGFTYRANRKYVFIKKPDADKEVRVRLTQELEVVPGETVRVGERLF